MGTNYYLHKQTFPACECCGRPAEVERLHIGKSSGGWCFLLHVEPEEGIHDLLDWVALWRSPGALIRDEYGRETSPEKMLCTIVSRGGEIGASVPLIRGGGEPGPRGLFRTPIAGTCIGHGEGTWDLKVGEFS